jgi:hypothetical protein
MKEQLNAYKEKLKQIDAEREFLKTDLYLQAKIEAHLEMLCLLGFMDILEQTKRKRAKNGQE